MFGASVIFFSVSSIMIGCPLRMYWILEIVKKTQVSWKRQVISPFHIVLGRKKLATKKQLFLFLTKLIKCLFIIPTMMVSSHCLLQCIGCSHKVIWGHVLLLITFFFVCFIPACEFLKRHRHRIVWCLKRKTFLVSVHCLPHQLRSNSYVFCSVSWLLRHKKQIYWI